MAQKRPRQASCRSASPLAATCDTKPPITRPPRSPHLFLAWSLIGSREEREASSAANEANKGHHQTEAFTPHTITSTPLLLFPPQLQPQAQLQTTQSKERHACQKATSREPAKMQLGARRRQRRRPSVQAALLSSPLSAAIFMLSLTSISLLAVISTKHCNALADDLTSSSSASSPSAAALLSPPPPAALTMSKASLLLDKQQQPVAAAMALSSPSGGSEAAISSSSSSSSTSSISSASSSSSSSSSSLSSSSPSSSSSSSSVSVSSSALPSPSSSSSLAVAAAVTSTSGSQSKQNNNNNNNINNNNVIIVRYANLTSNFNYDTLSQSQQVQQPQLNIYKLYDEPLSVSVIESRFSHSIQLFDVSQNQLATLPKDLFCPLPNEVALLNISYNLLENFDCLGLISQNGQLCLNELRVLDMSHNLIRHLPATGVATLRNLEVLNLSNNLIESLDELSLSSLFKLRHLDLSKNRIEQLPLRIFHKSTSMQALKLQSNHIQTSISQLLLSGLISIEELSLADNNISQISDYAFLDKINLTRVDFRFNRLSSLRQEALQVTQSNSRFSINQQTASSPSSSSSVATTKHRLHHNGQLASLTSQARQHQSQSPVTSLQVDFLLSGNPFVCDCHLGWMRKFAQPAHLLSVRRANNIFERSFSSHSMHSGFNEDPMMQLSSDQQNNQNNNNNNRIFQNDQPTVISADSSSSSAAGTSSSNNISEIIGSSSSDDSLNIPSRPILANGNGASSQFQQQQQQQQQPIYGRIIDLDYVKCTPLYNRNSHQHRNGHQQQQYSRSSLMRATPPGDLHYQHHHATAHHSGNTIHQDHRHQQHQSHNHNHNNQYQIDLLTADSTSFLCNYKSHCFALCQCCEFDACDCEMICPVGCSCYYDLTLNTNIIDCSANNHTVVPDRIPMDVSGLYLDGNNIDSLRPSNLIARSKLKALYLNSSNLFFIANRTFNGLIELQTLHLNDNQLRSLEGYEFEPLAQLRALYLQSNRLEYISNTTFIYLRSLEVLDLSNNRLTSQNLDLFWSIGHHNIRLRSLSIAHNWWSCQCQSINKFRQILRQKFLVAGGVNIADKSQLRCYYNSTTVGPLILSPLNSIDSAQQQQGPATFLSSFPIIGGGTIRQQQQQQSQQQQQLTELNQCSESLDEFRTFFGETNPPILSPPDDLNLGDLSTDRSESRNQLLEQYGQQPAFSSPTFPGQLSQSSQTPLQPIDPNQVGPAQVFPISTAVGAGTMPLGTFLLIVFLCATLMAIAVSVFLFVRQQQQRNFNSHQHHGHHHHSHSHSHHHKSKSSSAASTTSASSSASSTAISSLNNGAKMLGGGGGVSGGLGQRNVSPHHLQHQHHHHHHHHLPGQTMNYGGNTLSGNASDGGQIRGAPLLSTGSSSGLHHHSSSSQSSNIYAALVSPTSATNITQPQHSLNTLQNGGANVNPYSNNSMSGPGGARWISSASSQHQIYGNNAYIATHQENPYAVHSLASSQNVVQGGTYKASSSLYNACHLDSSNYNCGPTQASGAGNLSNILEPNGQSWSAIKLPNVKQLVSRIVNKSLALGGYRSASRDELSTLASDKIYDAFISYDKRDEAFVMQHLSAELEYGQPQYRVADRFRDLPLPTSAYIAEAITSVISCSYRTIMVLTENYLSSDWCRYELRAALAEAQTDKSHKIIAVVLDPKCLLELDVEMRALLTQTQASGNISMYQANKLANNNNSSNSNNNNNNGAPNNNTSQLVQLVDSAGAGAAAAANGNEMVRQSQQQQLVATLTSYAGGNQHISTQTAQLATSRITFINYNERKFWPKLKQLMPTPRPTTQTLTLTTKN